MSDYSQKLAEYCENQIGTLIPIGDGEELHMDPHQQEAMQLASVALQTNEKAFSIIHSCGSGKTILEGNIAVASQRAKEELGMQNTQDIVLTTQRALLHSIYEKLEGLGLDVGMWGSKKVQLDRPLVLANIQAVQNSIARGDLSKKIKIDETPLLIGDEADLFLTQSRRNAVSQFVNAIKVGLTATDKWSDGRDVEDLWGEKIHEMRLKEGILNGVNVPPLYYLFEANLDDSQLQYVDGDYEQKTLQAALKEAEIQKAIPEVYEALVPKNRRKAFPTIVYVPSVNLVHATVQELMDRFSEEDLAIGSWTGESTTTTQLKNDMEAFNKGELDILVLCEMGSRGVDLPRARFLIDAYPTLSSTKLEQRDGRVLRRIREESELNKEGFKKAFAMIAQIIPQSNKYRPVLLPDVLDCWDDFREGRLLGVRTFSSDSLGGDGGSPIQYEVDEIRKNILRNKPNVFVRKVEEIDVLSQLSIRENLPQADEDGFFEINGEIYGTVFSWSKVFGIASGSIKKYLEGEKGITGKDVAGNIRKNSFYCESVVREKCKHLLQEVPQADESGFFELDGEKYGTIEAWARELDISVKSIKTRLKGKNGITGKGNQGHISKNRYYSESVVREKCKDLLQEMPQADEGGFFVINGEKYGTRRAWARELKITNYSVRKCLKGEEGITGKDTIGHVRKKGFYSESVVREKCKRFLQELPQADENGFFVIEGERYGTKKAWMREFKVSGRSIQKYLENEKGITGKDTAGNIRENKFYPESLVRRKIKEFSQELPQADENGFFEIDGEKYGTVSAWAREFKNSYSAIKRRLKFEEGITGKNCNGRVWENKFYSESVVREKCKDLLQEMPQANEAGFFEIDGEKYRTRMDWARAFGVMWNTIKKYLEGEEGITGKDNTGYIRKKGFYSESVVMAKCKRFLQELPQADENGFFEIEGERYSTAASWSRVLGIAGGSIRKYLEGEEGITGKDFRGHIWVNKYYSEAIVREKCKHLLQKVPQANEDGFFEIDGGKYGTKEAWSRKLKVSTISLKKYLEGEEGITGKSCNGIVFRNGFYSESVVREKLAHLLNQK